MGPNDCGCAPSAREAGGGRGMSEPKASWSRAELLELTGGVTYSAFVLHQMLAEADRRLSVRARSAQTGPRTDEPIDGDSGDSGAIDLCEGVNCDTLRQDLIRLANKYAPVKREWERTGDLSLIPVMEPFIRELARIVVTYRQCCMRDGPCGRPTGV